MNDDDFQWANKKAASNYAKHGVSFENAKLAFNDLFSLEKIDDREWYGEERLTIIGMVHDRILFVVYTMRGEAIRIISARGAEPKEEREYYDYNS
jgi:uncharacterized protein